MKLNVKITHESGEVSEYSGELVETCEALIFDPPYQGYEKVPAMLIKTHERFIVQPLQLFHADVIVTSLDNSPIPNSTFFEQFAAQYFQALTAKQ